MPIAAVPGYLGSDFSCASPALRFGTYLPIWTERADQEREVRERAEKRSREGQELKQRLVSEGMDAVIKDLVQRERLPGLWDKNEQGGRTAWKEIVDLTSDDQIRMKALADRKAALFQTMTGGTGLELMAQSTAPFTTGLGNEHPLENGFTFLNPYGLPCLPGSGVKGIIRRAAEELAHRDFFKNNSGWTLPAVWHLFGFEPWLTSASRKSDTEWKEWIDGFSVDEEEIAAYLDAVLGENPEAHKKLKCRIRKANEPMCALRTLLQERHLHIRGALEFWDVIPQIKGQKLTVEIMTPHHSHYYQNKAHAGSSSPHDSGQPNPISFLTVPPGSDFVFHVRCDHRRLSWCAPELAADDRWRTLLEAAFKHAFEWLGFGAKTAVGYGAMKLDPWIEEEARKQAEKEAAIRVQQEKERRRREAEKAAADQQRAEQEAFDALPDIRKRFIEVERALKVFQEGNRFDKSHLLNKVKSQANRLTDEAHGWPEAAEREEAAKFLEQLYDIIGWHDPGMKTTKQKKKQVKKRQDAIERIRRGD